MKPILIISTILFGCSTYAQGFDRAKMEAFFDRIEAADRAMGSVSIFQDGIEVYTRSVGKADVQNAVPSNNQTKYRIGSISKTFTAVIVMQMVEEGKLSLNTRLSEYFPEVPNAEDITIEMMLRHRSGIFNFTNDPNYQGSVSITQSREALLKRIARYPPSSAPNEKAEYSNSNYVLLSMIAEKADEKTFETILQDRITKPLGLERTEYGSKIDVSDNQALSYERYNGWRLSSETDMSIPMGAGAIVSTPTELNIFFKALFAEKLVPKASLKQMKKMVDGIGIGLFEVPFYNQKALGHNGGIDGFVTNAQYFPKEGIGIAMTYNGMNIPMNNILIGVMSIYFDKAYELPNFPNPYDVSSEQLDQYLGVYSAPDFPFKLTISKEGNSLIAQATGQQAIALEAVDMDKFIYMQIGATFTFIPGENKLLFLQGKEFTLTKEE